MRNPLLHLTVGMLVLTNPLASANENVLGSVWEGVYTEIQAEKGSAAMTKSCIECHAANMKGGPGVPPLVGIEFRFGWDNRSLGELYEYLVTTMPTGQPGSLSDQAYADVIALLLKLNGIPASSEEAELAPGTAALDNIILTFKPPE